MALLAERFQLQWHTETRDMQAFTIGAPKSPGAMKPATADKKYSQRMTNGDVVFTAASMSSLTNFLSQAWMASVDDQTKLEGAYDLLWRSRKSSAIPAKKVATGRARPWRKQAFAWKPEKSRSK